jgi:predicted permease
LPAVQASQPELTTALKSGSREGSVSRSRTRTTLLIAQAALAVVLLSGAGLFVRSLQKVANTTLGIDIDRVLVTEVEHASVGMSNAEALELFRRFTERAPTVPGVTAAATSIGLSFGLGWSTRLSVPGKDQPDNTNNPSQYAVTPDYFEVMGIRLLDGRTFTDADRAGTELVAVINETTARTFWPGEDPVGQCVRIGADTMPCTTVVGIVTNARRQRLVEEPVSQVYRPLDQIPASVSDRTVSFFGYSMVARTSRDPLSVAEPLLRVLQASAPNVPYAHVRPLAERLGRQTRPWTLGATMFSIFGALSLVLAAIGLYSVVAFSVAQRTHEFGVRVALGASARSLLRLTLLRGVAPAAAGILVGLGFALAASRVLEGLLFELSPRDPVVFGTVGLVLLVSAVAASLVPAIRATRVDPMTALRSD